MAAPRDGEAPRAIARDPEQPEREQRRERDQRGAQRQREHAHRVVQRVAGRRGGGTGRPPRPAWGGGWPVADEPPLPVVAPAAGRRVVTSTLIVL